MAVPLRDPELDPEASGSRPAPADVGVVMAMPIEAGYLLDKLERVRRYNARSLTVTEGEIEGRVVAVIVSGVGLASARRAPNICLAGHRPRSPGLGRFRRGIDPELGSQRPGSAAVHHRRHRRRRRGRSKPGRSRSGDPKGRAAVARRSRHHRLAREVQLRSEHQADLIDMETFGVAVAAHERDVPFASLRVISDNAGPSCPPRSAAAQHFGQLPRGCGHARVILESPLGTRTSGSCTPQAMEASDRLASGLQVLFELV